MATVVGLRGHAPFEIENGNGKLEAYYRGEGASVLPGTVADLTDEQRSTFVPLKSPEAEQPSDEPAAEPAVVVTAPSMVKRGAAVPPQG